MRNGSGNTNRQALQGLRGQGVGAAAQSAQHIPPRPVMGRGVAQRCGGGTSARGKGRTGTQIAASALHLLRSQAAGCAIQARSCGGWSHAHPHYHARHRSRPAFAAAHPHPKPPFGAHGRPPRLHRLVALAAKGRQCAWRTARSLGTQRTPTSTLRSACVLDPAGVALHGAGSEAGASKRPRRSVTSLTSVPSSTALTIASRSPLFTARCSFMEHTKPRGCVDMAMRGGRPARDAD